MGTEPILIAGAGIGGLTAANALRRRGFETVVYERAPELRPVGAGIALQANAVRALSLLGLDTPAREAGWSFIQGQVRRPDGRVIGSIGLADLVERIGAPMVGIHRAKLQEVLLEGAGEVVTGLATVGFETEADGVTLNLADGTTRTGTLLIGADGIHSVIRAQLHGAAKPRYAGYTCWRGVAPVKLDELDMPDVFETWGRGHRFGGVRIDRDHVYWFAVRNAPANTNDDPATRTARVAEMFSGYASPVPELIEAASDETILHNDIVDRPPLAHWGEGRVTLLGDAAHAMTPNMGQGACQAIEDALVIADRLASSQDLEAGLRRYERDRLERANSFVDNSWRLGKMAQWSNPAACWLRDTLVSLTPESVVARQVRQTLTMTAVDEAGYRGPGSPPGDTVR